MTQASTWGVPQVGPVTPVVYAGRAQDSFNALLTTHRGASRPSYAVAGTIWAQTIDATESRLYYYDGTSDIYLGKLDLTNHVFHPVPAGLIDADEAVSEVSVVEFTGLVAGTRYRMEFEVEAGVVGANTQLGIQFGNSGGFDTGSNYQYNVTWMTGAGATGYNDTSHAAGLILVGAYINSYPAVGELYFSTDPSDGTIAQARGSWVTGNYNGVFNVYYDGASAIDRIRLIAVQLSGSVPTGTINGKVRLYKTN